MLTYFVDSPRDFANEYTVYAVESADLDRFAAAFPDASRVGRAEAIRLGWTRPRRAREDGEQWFGAFASARGALTLAEALEDAALATRLALATAGAGA